MIDIGRVCVKMAGRGAGRKVVVVDISKEKGFVLIDGGAKRKRCNISHLEPLDVVLKIKKGASTDDVVGAMKKAGIEVKKRKEVKKDKKDKKDKGD